MLVYSVFTRHQKLIMKPLILMCLARRGQIKTEVEWGRWRKKSCWEKIGDKDATCPMIAWRPRLFISKFPSLSLSRNHYFFRSPTSGLYFRILTSHTARESFLRILNNRITASIKKNGSNHCNFESSSTIVWSAPDSRIIAYSRPVDVIQKTRDSRLIHCTGSSVPRKART